MDSPWAAPLGATAFTAYLAFTFSYVIPYADEIQLFKDRCENNNGIVLTLDGEKMCFDKKLILEKHDN